MLGTMLEIAKSDIKAARRLLPDDDDMTLQQSAYYTQQALEKALKYCYTNYSIKLTKTHDIMILVNGLKENGVRLSSSMLEGLEDIADVLTMWEEKTRYPNDYMATRKAVVKAMHFVEQFISWVEDNIQPRVKARPSNNSGSGGVKPAELL